MATEKGEYQQGKKKEKEKCRENICNIVEKEKGIVGKEEINEEEKKKEKKLKCRLKMTIKRRNYR